MSGISHADGRGSKPPSRVWYMAAVLAVVAGEAVLTLDPGHYTIFHESESLVDGLVYSGTDVSGLEVSIEPVGGGPALALKQPGMTSSYEISGRAGRSVLAFDVAQPGKYRLIAGYPQGEAKSKAVLAVGRETVGGIVSLVLSVIGIIFLGVAIAVLIAVMTYRGRRAALAPR
jgi:hypothetical protein